MSEQGKTGLEIRREVMGDASRRARHGQRHRLHPAIAGLRQRACLGLGLRALPRKTRSLITLAALTALKCPQELGTCAAR